MRVSLWIMCAALLSGTAAGAEVGDYRTLPPDLAAAATAYDVAQFKSDRAGLERALADDFLLAGSNGKNRGKAEFIAEFGTPGSTTTSLDIHDQVFRVWQDGAVLAGVADAKGTDHGKPFAVRIRFADVWAKRDGQWRVVFVQANRVE
jgi:hypothetical protein